MFGYSMEPAPLLLEKVLVAVSYPDYGSCFCMEMIHPGFTLCLFIYYLKISNSSVNLHLENRKHILQIVEMHQNQQTELQAVDQKNALSRFSQLR